MQVILGHEEGCALLAANLDHVNTPFHVAAKMGRTNVLEVLLVIRVGTASTLSMQWNLLT